MPDFTYLITIASIIGTVANIIILCWKAWSV